MRPADTWKDYELLDATDGNRLERWGETLLIRPDPQVVWKTPKQSPLWAKADAIYHRSNQGGGEWEYKRRLPEKWKISCGEGEDKLTLIVSPTGFKHTGVFPEQAVNWAWYAQKIRAAGRPVKVLNLFGYTGGATLACAAAGDFCVALYNPSSRGRADYLAKAVRVLLANGKHPETVCGIVRNIGRDGQTARLLTLAELESTSVDMFTTVYIGNDATQNLRGRMVTPRGYHGV